jgi:hypothetical protein
VVIRDGAGGRGRWFFWSKEVGPEVVDLSFFSDFVDGRLQILVQDSTGMFLGRRATSICVSLHAAGLFIDSQSLFGDGAFSDLAWWRLNVSFGICLDDAGVGRRPLAMVVAENPRDRFVFLDLLGFYLQIQDNYFIQMCLLVFTYIAYCDRILINEICGYSLKKC